MAQDVYLIAVIGDSVIFQAHYVSFSLAYISIVRQWDGMNCKYWQELLKKSGAFDFLPLRVAQGPDAADERIY